MISVWLFFLVSLASESAGMQYYVEDIYIYKMNEEYLDPKGSNAEIVWLNETFGGAAANLTLIKPLPPGVTGHFNLYLKTMGEYKTHSGITVNLPWCKMISDPLMLNSLMTAMGLGEDNCPPRVGRYSTDLWYPTTDAWPDSLPGIDYKAVLAVMKKKTVIFIVWMFVSLY